MGSFALEYQRSFSSYMYIHNLALGVFLHAPPNVQNNVI